MVLKNCALPNFDETTYMTSIGVIDQNTDGLLVFHPKGGIEITEEGVLDFLSTIAEECPCRPVIYFHSTPHSITFEAISAWLESPLINSLAIMVTPGVNEAAAKTFLAINAQFPLRIFEEIDDAYEWSGYFLG